MKVELKREELDKCLSIVEKALPTHSTIPVIENILLEIENKEIIFTATNLELEIKVKLPSDNSESGKILLPPKIVDIVHSLPEQNVELNINWDRFSIDISSGTARYNIYGADPSEYPLVPEFQSEGKVFNINQHTLRKILKEVVFAASHDETRPAFNGVLFEFKADSVSLTSSDTYRLVVKDMFGQEGFSMTKYLIPAKSLRELLKILDDADTATSIFPHQNKVVFNAGHIYFATRVLDEKYPDVSGVIPTEYKTRLILERRPLEEMIARAVLLAEGLNQAAQISAANDQLTVKVSSQVGRMEESLTVRQEGEEIDLFINSRFILDILKVLDSREIAIDFHGKNGPVIFRLVDDESYLYLVLPIKMD